MDESHTRVDQTLARLARSLTTARRSLARISARLEDAERGQGLPEYALIISLIAVVAIAALVFLGIAVSGYFTDPINEQIGNVRDFIWGSP